MIPDHRTDRVTYITPGLLQERELLLVLDQDVDADPVREWLPDYHFSMIHKDSKAILGSINLRTGSTDRILLYRGHIGYSVQPASEMLSDNMFFIIMF